MRKRGSKTRDEWIASLRWNIQDARETLGYAISMSNWTGARKYIGQLEKLERQLYDAERVPAGGSWTSRSTVSGTRGVRVRKGRY